MSSFPPETTPPGGDYSFTPSDERLISFLRLKIAGEPLPATVASHFHDADIYAADPSHLTALFAAAPAKKGEGGSWFFFTRVRPKSSSDSRKSRRVAGGAGTWHSERAPRRVLDDDGNCAGHSQYFSYKLKTGKNCSERTEWYMVEFSDGGGQDSQEASHDRVHGGGGEPLVLCKIYKAHSHSRSGSGSASKSSCSASSARKRKTVSDSEASSPPVKAKRRLFDSPAPNSWPGKIVDVSNADGVVATSQSQSEGKIGDGEAAASQLKIGDTSDFFRFWPEPEEDYSMAGDVLCGRDAWASASRISDDTAAFVDGVLSTPVLPPSGEASWLSGSHDVWSY